MKVGTPFILNSFYLLFTIHLLIHKHPYDLCLVILESCNPVDPAGHTLQPHIHADTSDQNWDLIN